MSYQFVHVESYSRSGGRNRGHSVSDILAEARREPVSCLHVTNPKPPVLVAGCDLEELERRHNRTISEARETLANGKTRAVRKDTASLYTCVLSHPATPQECRADQELMQSVKSWAKDSALWLRGDLDARGGTLESVILHIDETHVHLHAYGLHPSGHADRLHAGKTAKTDAVAAALASGHDKKSANAIGNKSYVEAMRAWQDSYSTKVGLQHGLTRLGPARRRLSRAEWKAEQAAAKSVQEAKTLAKGAMDAITAAEATRHQILEEAQQKAHLSTLESHRRIEEAKQVEAAAAQTAMKAKMVLRDARQQRERILARAQGQLDRLRSIGTMIRALWDSLRRSSIREKVRQEMQDRIEDESRRAASAIQNAREEAQRRRTAESRLVDAIESVRAIGWERDKIRRQRDHLLGPVPIAAAENRPKIP